MSIEVWIQTLAILASPLAALWAGRQLQKRAEDRARKYWVLSTLVQTRHSIFADDRMRALNTIELAYGKTPAVRRLYQDYLAIAASVPQDQDMSPEATAKLSAKLLELIEAMTRSLGIHSDFTGVDYSRGYYPRFYMLQQQKQDRLFNAMTTFFERFPPAPPNPPSGPPAKR